MKERKEFKKRIHNDLMTIGYVTTIAGSLMKCQFTPGVGNRSTLFNPGQIISHPLAAKYFFISDNGGVRVMCMFFIINHNNNE